MLKTHEYKDFKREREIGGIIITLPEPPPIDEIANGGLPKEDQKFTPTAIPKDFNTNAQVRNDFIKQEFNRVREGYWFWNNGNLEYLTGEHYFYVNWWNIDIGLPDFLDSDRDYFYFWKRCQEDPDCYGMVNVENRRGGKTYRAGCALYHKISHTAEARGGIQSKNNADAKDVFLNAVIKPWQRLPYFFKPKDEGESHPKSSLRFYEPSKRDTKNQHKVYGKALRSEIDYENSKEEAYDGAKLIRYIMDECGKTTESNVEETWYIVKECLAVGSEIVGKAILTSTVEEMERKGGANLWEIWQVSNPDERNENGETPSGLYRYFKPAYYGFRGQNKKTGELFVDEYGYSNVEAAKKYLQGNRTGLTGARLSSEKRKYPFTAEEAFRMDNKDSPFDVDRIYTQIDYNSSLPASMVVKGNLVWESEMLKVGWRPSENGSFSLSWRPKPEHRNKIHWKGSKPAPSNTDIVAGVDPFDHTMTTDNRKSNAAAYVLRKFNPMEPYDSNIFCMQYLDRPPKPEMFYDDMLKLAFYYGCEILCENNKIGMINYFRQKGCEHFLMKRPEPTHTEFSKKNQKEYGIPMAGKIDSGARDALIGAIQSYIYDNVGYIEEEGEDGRYGKCYFDDLLKDWVKFDVMNWTPHDCTVASGLALLAAKKYTVQPKKQTEPKQFFARYRVKGTNSIRIE